VLLDVPPVRHRVAEQDAGANRGSLPPACSGDRRSQSAVSVDGADEILNVDQLRLQLDHEQGATDWVEGEDVNDAPLAVDGERRLRRDQPSAQTHESARERLVHGRVACVHGTRQFAASPAEVESDIRLDGRRDPGDQLKPQSPDVTALDTGHRDLGRARACGHVGLAKAEPDADAPQRGAELDGIHVGESDGGRLPADDQRLISRLAAAYWRTP
jgi:hypothetical protein